MYEIILREFLGHNFVSGLRTLKAKKSENLKTFFSKNLVFSSRGQTDRHDTPVG